MINDDINNYINETVRAVADSVGRTEGDTYFEYLIKYLTEYTNLSCGVAYEFIENNPNHYRLITSWVSRNDNSEHHGQIDEHTIETLITGELYFIKNDIHNAFNSDKFIKKLDLRSLVVFSLYDTAKNVTGAIILFDRDNFPTDSGVLNIIESQIPRACAELDRSRIKRKLEIIESDYNYFIETVNDVVWTTDLSGALIDISKSCFGVYGDTDESIIGKKYTDFMSDSSADKFNQDCLLLRNGVEIHDIKADHYTNNGEIIHVSYSLKPKYNEHGLHIGVAGTTRDISASVQAQILIKNNSELFSSILARLPVIFFRIDQQGSLIDIRGDGLKRMGVEDMDWVGKPGYGLFLGMDDKINSALSGETVVFESKGKHDGNLWWFSTSMFFDSWAGFGAVGFSVDITDQKLFEDKLVELLNHNQKLAQRLIEVQEDERRSLSRELHDELGQSITAVKSLAKAITANSSGQYTEIRSLGNSIIDLSGRLYDVVNNIMQRLRPDIIDGLGFDESIKNCIVRSQLEKIGVNCVLNIIGDINQFEDIVKITIYRIIQECLTNISKHAMASNVNILIRRDHVYTNTRCMVQLGSSQRSPYRNSDNIIDAVTIEIVDDGIGMAIDDGIFITNNNNRHGLQGMYERVTAIGGTLELHSKPGEGLKVLIALALDSDPRYLVVDKDSDNLETDNIKSAESGSSSVSTFQLRH